MSRSPAKTSTRGRVVPVKIKLEGGNQQLSNLCGPLDENLRRIADGLDLDLSRQADTISLRGPYAEAAGTMLLALYERAAQRALSIDDIQLALVEIPKIFRRSMMIAVRSRYARAAAICVLARHVSGTT